MENKIDLVLLWVDGSDPKWLEEKNQYSKVKVDYSSDANRFRDWDNMQYLFRGIEKFAPWVNNVFFITWGHLPKWMNPNHPKLKIINHKDYIPEAYRPTFNSNTIELNLHRIPELSENFILFNDDMFLLKETKPEDFFINGQPRDEFCFNPILPMGEKFRIAHTNVNNIGVVNKYFKKNVVVKKHRSKIYNLKYGKNVIRSFMLKPWNCFVGIRNPHLPISHTKSNFDKLWELEGEQLDATCLNRFRGYNDLNHWLMRYWNLCNGNFVPRKSSFGKYFNLSSNNKAIVDYITNKKGSMICINDMSTDYDFDVVKAELINAFDKILPEKSSFEK